LLARILYAVLFTGIVISLSKSAMYQFDFIYDSTYTSLSDNIGGSKGGSGSRTPLPSSRNFGKINKVKITHFESGTLFKKPKMIVESPPF
jgi:hypothetical protein